MATSLSRIHSWIRSVSAPALAGAILNAVVQAGRGIRRWSQLRADRRRLMEYPDHMLRDIGIARSEIDSALRHGREGRPLPAEAGFVGRTFPEWQYRTQSRRAA
jgi:uncharacterized protein YjiS (DUF1127 family)